MWDLWVSDLRVPLWAFDSLNHILINILIVEDVYGGVFFPIFVLSREREAGRTRLRTQQTNGVTSAGRHARRNHVYATNYSPSE